MSTLSNSAVAEIHKLQRECEAILATPGLTRGEGKRADVIIAKISSIRATGKSTDEMNQILATEQARELGVDAPEFRKALTGEQRAYKKYLQGVAASEIAKEVRDTTFVEGTQSISYSEGDFGGFLVPMEYNKDIREGMALADPLLDANIVTLVQEKQYKLRPLNVPGWDLSTAAAVPISETTQFGFSDIPTLSTHLLNSFGYRVAFDMSMEWEEDSIAYDPVASLMRAQGIAIARGVGADLTNGAGAMSNRPQGIVTGAADSGVTSAALGSLAFGDFSNVFFSINKIYRDAPKAAWLVNDAVMKEIVNAKDSSNRPLFPTSDGVTRILGKPVYTCPSLPAYNASLGTQHPGSFCVFGDLSAFVVHSSAVLSRRFTQIPLLVESGMVRVHSLILVDSAVIDPTDGAMPAIVSARLHA